MVKFGSFDLYRLAMPLKVPWRAGPHRFAAVETLLLKTEGIDGRPLWVESTPFSAPVFTNEWAAASFLFARDHLAPLLKNRSFAAEDLAHTLATFEGNFYAKALFDFAYWALRSQQEQRPLSKALGATRDHVAVSETLGVFASIDALVHAAHEAKLAGFRTVKLKFARGWEVEPLRAVRAAFPQLKLVIDCNGSYSLADAALFESIDALGLEMIEQPFGAEADLDHAELARRLSTPLCLDESARTRAHVERAVRLGACRFVHVKPARVGGLSPAKDIHDFCLAHGVGCVIGSHLESAIGTETTLALAMLEGFKTAGTIFPSSRQYADDLSSTPFELKNDEFNAPSAFAPQAPGLTRSPDPERLQRWTIERATIT